MSQDKLLNTIIDSMKEDQLLGDSLEDNSNKDLLNNISLKIDDLAEKIKASQILNSEELKIIDDSLTLYKDLAFKSALSDIRSQKLKEKNDRLDKIRGSIHEELLSASKEGNKDKIIDLLDKGADINVQDEYGYTPLMRLVRDYEGDDKVELFSIFIDKGVDLSITENMCNTALQLAKKNNSEEVYLQMKEIVNLKNSSQIEANKKLLYAADRDDSIEPVKSALEQGANINAKDYRGLTALMLASYNREIKTIQFLLEQGADLDATDNNGKTALMLAAWKGNFIAIKLLVEQGANIDAQDNNGNTALMNASWCGHFDTVRYLLEKGANVEAINKKGKTALALAYNKNRSEIINIINEFQMKDIDNKKIEVNKTFLNAAKNGDLELVKSCLSQGANIETQDEHGYTALMTTAHHNHLEVVKLLLEQNPNLDSKDYHGKTALMLTHNKEILELLLNKGANIEAMDDDGSTPLMLAAQNGYIEKVKLLLEHGADYDAKNNDAWTALILAEEEGHTKIVNMIEEYRLNNNSMR